ncbi:MAG: hypothetical protein ACM3QZ_14770 [Solirubrobacterales bacterium]
MLLFVNGALLLILAAMFLILAFCPGAGNKCVDVYLEASRYGPDLEKEFRHVMGALPFHARLVIVDDASDSVTSSIVDRLLIRNPGVACRRTVRKSHPAQP